MVSFYATIKHSGNQVIGLINVIWHSKTTFCHTYPLRRRLASDAYKLGN